VKRWLRWTFCCRRGRRCADVIVTNLDASIPPGTVAVVEYDCAGCGTHFTRSALAVSDGSFVLGERSRS
jgi:uncharacterized protein YuzB (UPF0349 family)